MTQRDQMEALVSAYRNSGQSKKAFCQTQGIKYSKFRYWTHKIKKEESPAFIPIHTGHLGSPNHSVEIHFPNGVQINLNHWNLEQIQQLLHLS